MKTDFDKMWSNKYLWTSFFEALYFSVLLTALSFISIGIVYLIPFPAEIAPSSLNYLKMFISVGVCIAIFLVVGLQCLNIAMDLSDLTFFAFKSKKWKQRWNLVNYH